jgi:hypothetical protein
MGPDRIVVLHQYQRIWRYVWMDGKHDAADEVRRPGRRAVALLRYSVGRWEGDNTLVINTVGVTGHEWLDKAGHPHSVECEDRGRFTRPTTITCRWL